MFVSMSDILAAPEGVKSSIDADIRAAKKKKLPRPAKASVSAFAERRTGQPVRRHSHRIGREGLFWQRVERKDVRAIVLAARRYELAGRQPGERSGPLGFVAIEVLELLANLVDYRTGRLDPSLDYIMAKLKRSRDAVTRALAALRIHGFLDWLRRYEPTGQQGRGPQVRQVSNAYRLSLPARAKRLLGRLLQPAPPPDDFMHARAMQRAAVMEYRATLSHEQLALFELGDNDLGRTLARLGRLIQERESAKRSESDLKKKYI